MEILSSKYKYWIRVVVIWTILNLIFSSIGLFASYLLSDSKVYIYTEYLLFAVKYVILQGLLFSIFTIISTYLFNNRIFAYYSYALFQFILFNIIFFCNLEINENKIDLVMNDLSIAYKYLYINGQYLFDFLYSIVPFGIQADGGVFVPSNLLYFYFMWIILPVTCYFIYTVFSLKIAKLISKDCT